MALDMHSSSLSDINCVKGEIHNVLAIMRLNNRWAKKERFEKEIPLHSESPLMRSLKSLHDQLTIHGYRKLSEVDTVHFLQPFLDIVTSPLTTGPITGAALSSLHKFLLYGFVQPESLRASEGINLIAAGISRCVFEESDAYSDEVVLMKVLELSALCVRCDVGTLLKHEGIVSVFTKCLQVSKEETRRSSLLRSTADNTMAHIVLVVFSRARVHTPKDTEDDWGESIEVSEEDAPKQAEEDEGGDGGEGGKQEAIVSIMETLSGMCNPRGSSEQVCVLSLSLINIALEAGGDHLGLFPSLVCVMQGDLCKHLLQNSQSADLTILSLTLRVVFNLFNSIKDHLKVQLEVFLTSVHLRLLDLDVAVSHERRELALESLLEFCHEPTLMLDLYINYDCDVQCTNLFETVCNVLAVHALPQSGKGINSINRLALDGLLSIIATISAQCAVTPSSMSEVDYESDDDQSHDIDVGEWGVKPAGLSSPSTSLATSTNSLGSEYSKDGENSSDDDRPRRRKSGNLEFLAMAREKTAEVLQQRKRIKRRLSLVTERFNTDESLKKFIPYAVELELLPKNPDPQAIAQLLKTTPGLDKTQIGMYIGKGPADKYPINAAVLKSYVGLFDFSNLSFDESFRLFLEEFRLPGEAQCIDRIMETFAAEVFRQCPNLPFKNEDAAFVLAFSLIMLNTDLHNPRIDDARRMTLEQFVSSNRDTNGGESLPFNFMKNLYNSIKESEIELKGGVGGEMAALETGKLQWGRLVASRAGTIASASFTPSSLTARGLYPAGVHERDMFTCIAQGTFRALVEVLTISTDDFLVLKTLQGVYRLATIANYYQMNDRLNGALVSLLETTSEWMKEEKEVSVDTPKACFLRDLARRKEVSYPWPAGEGSAQHVGVVSLHTALEIMADFGTVMSRASWDGFIAMLTVLLDKEALPTALVHLDDLTDLRGNQLKPAPYIRSPQFRSSQRTWIEGDQHNSVNSDEAGLLSSFKSLFWSPSTNKGTETAEAIEEVKPTSSMKSAAEEVGSDNVGRSATLAMSSMLKMVLDVEALFSPVRPANEPRWSRSLSDGSLVNLMKSITDCRKDAILQPLLSVQRKKSDDMSPSNQGSAGGGSFWNRSAVAAANAELIGMERKCEGRAVFKLELAARVLSANISRLHIIFPIFFSHCQALLTSPKIATRMPFLLERCVVIILRIWPLVVSQSIPDSANFLNAVELLLLVPPTFSHSLSDRIAYGVAGLFSSTSTNQRAPLSEPNHWSIALELLSNCAENPRGRCAVVDAMSVYLRLERAPNVPLLLQSANLSPVENILHKLSSVEEWVSKYGSCSEGTKASTSSGENILPPTREMLAACATSLTLLAQFVDILFSNHKARLEALDSSKQTSLAMHDDLLPPATHGSAHILTIEEEESLQYRNKLLVEGGELVSDYVLFGIWKRALVQLRNSTELAHFSTVKACCDGMQRILTSTDQILQLSSSEEMGEEQGWTWLFNEVLFKQGPLLRVLHTTSLRPMDSHCEARALLCCGVASKCFLHHLSTLSEYPTLLEGIVLKMARLYGTVFKYTRSEAAAESLMNILTVVQVEIRTKTSFKAVMSRAREIVDSLSPALTEELHSRAPGLHPSALHKVVVDEKMLRLQQAAEAAMVSQEADDTVEPLQLSIKKPPPPKVANTRPIVEKAASFTV